ncbi:MAG TPA: hypothetical protein VFE61_25075 [Candidatus Sulfotelmatobacter sp.]|nr:hypothetical protein [Candidatus Sulfotelmatobacter sp.]
MTLAIILLVCLFGAASAPPVVAATARQSTQQPVTTDKPAAAEKQEQDTPPPAQNAPKPTASPTPAQTSSGQKPATAPTHKRHKKKVVNANCVTAPATSSAGAPSAPQDPAATNTTTSTAPTPTPPAAPTNCPPPRIVVPQGGAPEPSIQLAGGAVGDQATDQRTVANQMLGATEDNLKKMAGRQLTQSQQDMVSQIHQFVDQSKSAVEAGDLDRARTLAWKAQLLSEELTKTDK